MTATSAQWGVTYRRLHELGKGDICAMLRGYALMPSLFDHLMFDGTRKMVIADLICEHYQIFKHGPEAIWWHNIHAIVQTYPFVSYRDKEFNHSLLDAWNEIRSKVDDMIHAETGFLTKNEFDLGKCFYNDV